MKHLDETAVWNSANLLYNDACNKDDFERAEACNRIYGPNCENYHTRFPPKFDRKIEPRSTKAAMVAVVRAINEALNAF